MEETGKRLGSEPVGVNVIRCRSFTGKKEEEKNNCVRTALVLENTQNTIVTIYRTTVTKVLTGVPYTSEVVQCL